MNLKIKKLMNLFFFLTTPHSQSKKGETFGNDMRKKIIVGEIIPEHHLKQGHRVSPFLVVICLLH